VENATHSRPKGEERGKRGELLLVWLEGKIMFYSRRIERVDLICMEIGRDCNYLVLEV
jgi:hypothetical protein